METYYKKGNPMKKFAAGVFTGWLATQVVLIVWSEFDPEFGEAFLKAYNRALDTSGLKK